MECYESYDKKPLHSLKADMFVCIPCMTLATQRVPEIEDDEGKYIQTYCYIIYTLFELIFI